jgi:haloalkane dehalogenase
MRYREAGALGAPVALLLHGWPNSSHMWEPVLESVASAGYRAVAPDFPGYGDTPLNGSTGTWEEHVAALDAFVEEHDLAPVALVVHDWGGLIGLRWACEHPEKVRSLVISGTGFFPDGKWHGMAKTMRDEREGDQLMEGLNREAFSAVLRGVSPGMTEAAIDASFAAFGDTERRTAMLTMYRSGDFEKLAPHEGSLAALGVPTLLLWGETDPFAPVASAHRFAKEIPHAELVVLPGVGHFLVDDAPDRVAGELGRFLRGARTA